jgi:hypothetical protein
MFSDGRMLSNLDHMWNPPKLGVSENHTIEIDSVAQETVRIDNVGGFSIDTLLSGLCMASQHTPQAQYVMIRDSRAEMDDGITMIVKYQEKKPESVIIQGEKRIVSGLPFIPLFGGLATLRHMMNGIQTHCAQYGRTGGDKLGLARVWAGYEPALIEKYELPMLHGGVFDGNRKLTTTRKR